MTGWSSNGQPIRALFAMVHKRVTHRAAVHARLLAVRGRCLGREVPLLSC